MSGKKLVVLGSINADHILNVQEFPRPGETITGQGYRISLAVRAPIRPLPPGAAGPTSLLSPALGKTMWAGRYGIS